MQHHLADFYKEQPIPGAFHLNPPPGYDADLMMDPEVRSLLTGSNISDPLDPGSIIVDTTPTS